MGDPVKSGVVLVSRDLVAADVTGARLMGLDPEKVAVHDGGRTLPGPQSRSELITQRGEDPTALTRSLPSSPRVRDDCRVEGSQLERRQRRRPGRRSRAWSARPQLAPALSTRRTSKTAPDARGCVGIRALAVGLDRARGRPLLLCARHRRASTARPVDPPGRARVHRPRPKLRGRGSACRPWSHHARVGCRVSASRRTLVGADRRSADRLSGRDSGQRTRHVARRSPGLSPRETFRCAARGGPGSAVGRFSFRQWRSRERL